MVEIGPGGGILTEQLIAAGARVIAIELDLAWGFSLLTNRRLGPVRLVLGDALEFEFERLPQGALVTGNLPFHIGTVLIDRVLRRWRNVTRAGFLVQREVGDRLLAPPGSRAYGAVSVLTAARAQARRLGLVKRGAFRPPPKVDALFVGFDLQPPPLPEPDMERFAALVRLAFSQRRKQIHNALGSEWGRRRARQVLADAAVAPRARAQDLKLVDYLQLYRSWAAADPAAGGR